jgi:hypothetical protein
MSVHAPEEANVRALRPPRAPSLPRAEPWGLLIVQRAILEGADAELAAVERRMSGAQTEASVIRHGLTAVEVLTLTCRLLETQRAVMVERLAEVLRSAPAARPEHPSVPDPAPPRTRELGEGG